MKRNAPKYTQTFLQRDDKVITEDLEKHKDTSGNVTKSEQANTAAFLNREEAFAAAILWEETIDEQLAPFVTRSTSPGLPSDRS